MLHDAAVPSAVQVTSTFIIIHQWNSFGLSKILPKCNEVFCDSLHVFAASICFLLQLFCQQLFAFLCDFMRSWSLIQSDLTIMFSKYESRANSESTWTQRFCCFIYCVFGCIWLLRDSTWFYLRLHAARDANAFQIHPISSNASCSLILAPCCTMLHRWTCENVFNIFQL